LFVSYADFVFEVRIIEYNAVFQAWWTEIYSSIYVYSWYSNYFRPV